MTTSEQGFEMVGVAAQAVIERLSEQVVGRDGRQFETTTLVTRRSITRGLPNSVAALVRFEVIVTVRAAGDGMVMITMPSAGVHPVPG